MDPVDLWHDELERVVTERLPPRLRRPAALGSLVLAVSLTLAAVSATGRAAWAQTPPDGADAARVVFEDGVRLARAQQWPEALAAFERSRALADRPGTALNVAIARRQLGRLRAARQALRECLAMPQTAAEPDLGRDAALLLGMVVDAIPSLSFTVDPGGAAVQVDGEAVADPRVVELDPGAHAVVVTAPGRAPEEFSVTLRAGERAARTVRLRELPARVEVRVSPADARVYINDALVGRGSARWEGAAGTVRVRATRVDHHDLTRDLVVAPGAQATERLTLSPVQRPLYTRPWFWVGVAAAVAVAAGVTTAVALSSSSGSSPLDGGSTGAVLYAY